MIELHEAYVRGDLAAVKDLLGDPPDFPNCRGPYGVGEIILEYAIYHSPLLHPPPAGARGRSQLRRPRRLSFADRRALVR
jgi:hypothetical protein